MYRFGCMFCLLFPLSYAEHYLVTKEPEINRILNSTNWDQIKITFLFLLSKGFLNSKQAKVTEDEDRKVFRTRKHENMVKRGRIINCVHFFQNPQSNCCLRLSKSAYIFNDNFKDIFKQLFCMCDYI